MTMADGSETNSDVAMREQLLEAVIADYIRACEAGNPPDLLRSWPLIRKSRPTCRSSLPIATG